MAEKLSQEQVQEKLEQLKDWQLSGDKIEKEYSFKNFKQAWDFVNQVAELAEEKQHHPEIWFTWGKVVIQITNHEAGGVTESDTELAEAIENL